MQLKEFAGRILFRTLGRCPLSLGRNIRALCGKLILAHCGVHVNIHKSAHISPLLALGNYSGVGENAILQGRITIGSHVMMGPDVKVYSMGHQTGALDTPMMFQGTTRDRPVQIDDDVWIGANVIILPGVHIGQGAVLGAGSVIRKDVPPYAVVIGNPSSIARYRTGAGPHHPFSDKDEIRSTRRVDPQGTSPLGR